MRTNCHGVCKYTSKDTTDDINLAGKHDKYEFDSQAKIP